MHFKASVPGCGGQLVKSWGRKLLSWAPKQAQTYTHTSLTSAMRLASSLFVYMFGITSTSCHMVCQQPPALQHSGRLSQTLKGMFMVIAREDRRTCWDAAAMMEHQWCCIMRAPLYICVGETKFQLATGHMRVLKAHSRQDVDEI